MKPEMMEKIIAHNRSVKENVEKASDLDALVSAIKQLPPGQLKKVLSDDVIAVLVKYGVEL